MFSSWKLGKPFGIDLYIHATFWLLPLLVFITGLSDAGAALFDVAVILAVFACVALHEYGHALAARYYGIATRDITLYPIGGIARLERMPERPLHEIVVALAGPAVNVVIALGLAVGLYAGQLTSPDAWSLTQSSVLGEFVFRVLIVNVFLVVFNLIPAFPMDGGRVLRAMLGIGMRRTDATRIAVSVGTVIAAVFVLVGLGGLNVPPLNIPSTFSLVLIGAMVFVLGRKELAYVQSTDPERRRERRNRFFQNLDFERSYQSDRFTGWRWDPAMRIWSEWQDGVLVREVAEN